MKKNFRSLPFNGDPPAEKSLEIYEGANCYCSGANKEKHTWFDPRCLFYRPRQSQLLLEAPKENSPPIQGGSAQQINSTTSMFQHQDDWKTTPLKSTSNPAIGFDPPMTIEVERLCAAFNRAMLRSPQDFFEVMDGRAMTVKATKDVVAELHIMGYAVIEEDIPFGEC